jgi:predicted dehydrogenase
MLDERPDDVEFVAALARRPERSERLQDIKDQGIPIFKSFDAFYDAGIPVDMMIINSPMQYHLEQTVGCLERGTHVYCEKPVAGTVQDGYAMAEAEKRTGKFAAIGYQWSFTDAIQALKHDILDGRFGKARRMKTVVFWSRNKDYYARNDWAARLKSSDGRWILDSPLCNATAHFLHNMYYLLGKTRETSAFPVELQAELYRANDIENYDTAAVRCRTGDDVELLFYTTHACPSSAGPIIRYEFEKGTVYFEHADRSTPLVARFNDGTIKNYGMLWMGDWSKLWKCADAVRGGPPPACTAMTAIPLTLSVNAAQESMPDIVTFPENMIHFDKDQDLVWVNEIQQAFIQCYDQAILPSEHGALAWARAGKVMDLKDYRVFPSQ